MRLALLLSLLISMPALAIADSESDAQARELFYKGEQHYAAGRYERAAVLYEGAYELSDRPAILFALANAHERMGNLDKAARYLRLYVRSAKPENKSDLMSRIEILETKRDQEKLAKEKTRIAEEEQRLAKRIALLPKEEKAKPGSTLGVVALAGGGVGLVSAATFGLLSMRSGNKAENFCKDGLCSGSASSALSKEKNFALAADISLAFAVVSVGTGLYLLLRSQNDDEKEPAKPAGQATRSASTQRNVSVVPQLFYSGAGVGVYGRF